MSLMLVNIAPSRDEIYLNSNEGQKYMNQLNYFFHTLLLINLVLYRLEPPVCMQRVTTTEYHFHDYSFASQISSTTSPDRTAMTLRRVSLMPWLASAHP